MRKEELRRLDATIAELLDLPCYTTDGNAMLELDKKMRERGFYVTVVCKAEAWKHGSEAPVHTEPYFHAQYMDVNNMTFTRAKSAPTEPLARALAAYIALTGKEWTA